MEEKFPFTIYISIIMCEIYVKIYDVYREKEINQLI